MSQVYVEKIGYDARRAKFSWLALDNPHTPGRARSYPIGTVKATKTARGRAVRLLPPLAAELKEWRLMAGRPPDHRLVIATDSGRLWTNTDWQIWRRDHWAEACREAGIDPAPRPYDLRHSFASLLLAEGR